MRGYAGLGDPSIGYQIENIEKLYVLEKLIRNSANWKPYGGNRLLRIFLCVHVFICIFSKLRALAYLSQACSQAARHEIQ